MKTAVQIVVPRDRIEEFCRRCHILKLSLFGSVLTEDFRPDSDVDVLVEFESGHVPGFIGLYRMEQELSKLLGGRNVDMVTPKSLNRRIREQILANAEIQYAKG